MNGNDHYDQMKQLQEKILEGLQPLFATEDYPNACIAEDPELNDEDTAEMCSVLKPKDVADFEKTGKHLSKMLLTVLLTFQNGYLWVLLRLRVFHCT